MTSIIDLANLGKEIGYEGQELADFIKEQQDNERESRARERERLDKEREKIDMEREKIKEEKEKLELELRYANVRRNLGDDIGGATAGHAHSGDDISWGSWTTKLIPRFDESDVGMFFRAFEKVASQLEWNKVSWAVLVQSVFKGKAQLAFSSLSDEDSQDYDKVKSAVLTAYQLVPEAYRLKFRNLEKKKETYLEFARSKCIKFDEWLRAAKIDCFESLREAILLEDFKNGLPAVIRTHLEEFNVTKVEEAAEAADRFVISHKLSEKNKSSNNSWSPRGKHYNRYKRGHDRRKDSPSKASASESEESKATSVTGSPKRGQGRGRQITCYECHKIGHIKSNCPTLKGNVSLIHQSNEVTNSKLLNDYGDYVWYGEMKSSESSADVHKVVMLRDSGATQSCVLRSALPKDFVCKGGNFVLLGGFPSSVTSCSLEDLYINSVQCKGLHKFAVADILPVDGVQVVIGNDIAGTKAMYIDKAGYSGLPSDTVEVSSRPVCVMTRSHTKADVFDDDNIDLGDLDLDNLPEVKVGNKVVKCNSSERLGVDVLPSREELSDEQKNDLSLKSCVDDAVVWDGEVENLDLSKGAFVNDNGLIYRLSRPLVSPSNEDSNIKKELLIPKCHRELILKEAHEGPWGGHLGISKTLNNVRRNFYWPTVKKDVVRHCKSCHVCQVVGKPNETVPKAPLFPIPAVSEPFSEILIDIVGPLPKSSSGMEYILTIMDRTTRYPEAYPMRKIKSTKVLECLTEFFSRYGIPRVLQSDRGTNFTSRVFANRMKEWGITHVFSSPYHPESQGALERWHSTFKSSLHKYCLDNASKWDVNIPLVLFALRAAPSESLGFSPFEMVFGHNVRGPLDVIRDHWEGVSEKKNLLAYVSDFKEKLREICDWANNLLQAQHKMKLRYDVKSKNREFKEGDLVLVLLPIPGTFKAKYTAPGKILRKINELNYEVQLPD